MMRHIIAATAAGLLIATGTAAAQTDEAETRKAQPAEMMPLADKGIINALARAGDQFVAAGERGHILLSDDGDSWRQVPVPVRGMLTRVVFRDATHGWATGWDGAVLRTTDGGETWSLVNFEPDWGKPYFDILPTGADSATLVGSNGLMRTTDDGGESWTLVDSDVFAAGFHLYDLEQLADGTLLIAGERGMLARSVDGDTWDMLVPPYVGSYFGVLPVGEHGAVLYGLQGRVLYAEDVRALPALDDPMAYDPFAAESITDPVVLEEMGWRRLDNPSNESLFGGDIDDDGELTLVGVDGAIVHGDLESGELHLIESPTAEPLSDLIRRGDDLLLCGRTGLHTGGLTRKR
ncbi:MAG: YCF48-related protein [Salinisphaeraceae bacterium]